MTRLLTILLIALAPLSGALSQDKAKGPAKPRPAEPKYSMTEIVGSITNCLRENAPDDWRRLIFSLDEVPGGGEKKFNYSHRVVVGDLKNDPVDVVPCRPTYVPNAVNALRDHQDEKARLWTGITLIVEHDGKYTITYRYPK